MLCCHTLQGYGMDTVEGCVAAARLIHALLAMEDPVGYLRQVPAPPPPSYCSPDFRCVIG